MSDAAARVADATGNWVDRSAPLWSRPYLRLSRFDRPIGSWLAADAVLVVGGARLRHGA
jgi:4-hydroxybenzoate polyprenyltransferase